MIGTCLAEEAHTPELLQLLRSRTVLPRRELLLEVLAAARERAELREGVDPEVVVSALLGTFYADYLAGRFAVDEPGPPAGGAPAGWSLDGPLRCGDLGRASCAQDGRSPRTANRVRRVRPSEQPVPMSTACTSGLAGLGARQPGTAAESRAWCARRRDAAAPDGDGVRSAAGGETGRRTVRLGDA